MRFVALCLVGLTVTSSLSARSSQAALCEDFCTLLDSRSPPPTPVSHPDTSRKVELLDVDLAASALRSYDPRRPTRVTFWWHDCPVGHVDLKAAVRDVGIDLATLAATAVAPDVLARARTIVARQQAAAPSQLSASIVICTRDRPDELARCLSSLSSQTMRAAEVVVVDNASRDGRTREAALRAGVVYVREDRPGLDYARNAGARAATGRIVAYTDDDVRLHPRWLERMVAAFDGESIMAVTGLVLPAQLETEAQIHFETHWSFGRGYRPIDFDQRFFAADRAHGCPVWQIGAGASMAFRREIFETAGLFDERLDVGRAGCSGDSEYWHRVLTHGGICRYEPSAVVYHYHRRDLDGLSSQIFHYMRGHAAALMVQHERSGNIGNLRRAVLTMPLYYAGRAARRLVVGGSERDRFLQREISGYLAGLAFYLREPKPRRNDA